MSRKRGHSVTDKDAIVSKRLRNEDSEFPSNLQDKSRWDELHNACETNQYRNYFPHHLIGLMYQLDLSVLCSLRKFTYKYKYSSLSLVFEDSEIDKFNNIVLHYEKKSILIQIEHVDKYIDNDISYARLFAKEKRSFSINNYLDSFVKYLIFKSGSLLNNLDTLLNHIEYLIIYTNSSLDLTKEKKLKKGRSRNFYPFKFESIDIEECNILRDFLFTNDSIKRNIFYQFSQDKTREELLKRLEFSPAIQKEMKERKLSQEEIKEFFLDKLVFAVNQPNREELNNIIKNEIEKSSEVQDDYIALQERILRDLIDLQKYKKLGSGFIYEFNLLMFFLHDMFLHNISSINFERKSHDISNDITIYYKDKITYVKVYTIDNSINYSQLFSSRQYTFSINKLFTLFVEELKENIKYFIIYTNADLDLSKENRFKKGLSKDFYPLEFDNINIQEKKYKILRKCSCINKNGLYKFAQEEMTRETLLSLLKLPPCLQKKEGRLSNENEKEKKEIFLDKLIFAVNQPNKKKLKSMIKNEVEINNQSNKVPYNYEELYEIALRWSESHEFGPITEGIMKKLLEDIKKNRLSYQKIQKKNINEGIKFAKIVVGREGISPSNQFLDLLIKEKRLEILKINGINLSNMTSILGGAGANATKAFKDLYDLWFDIEGNKTHYLKILEGNGINLARMSSILSRARANAAKAFKDLYDLWFDRAGNKTQYLKTLEEKRITLARMSSILSGAGANAPKAFKDLYDLWFDGAGNKTQYLKTLEKEGINLANVSSILNRAGANAPKAFKELYNTFFDEQGNKTQYLKTLKVEGINLVNMSSILNGTGANATKAFIDLYDLWFDGETQYLKTLEEEGINLANMSSILHGAGSHAPKAFKDLYDLWFDKEGNKTQYLKTLEEEGINLVNVSSILNGAGANSAKAFKELYNIFFDEQGNKRRHLKHFIKKKNEESFTLHNLSSMLSGAGANVKEAFENLHRVCFADKGKRTELLIDFYNAGFKASNLSCISCRSGVHASSILKRLHSVCFNEKREKTKLLNNFNDVDLNPDNLCNLLSGAADSFKKFHDFCFVGKTKKYLNHFLNEKEGFTLKNLSNILHGARANICSAFKDFHDVCFDEIGNKTQLLDDFYKVGFTANDLSDILSFSGNNSNSILRNFHKLSFNKENYLNHFLAEKKLFTPKNLSRLLKGAGMKVCTLFEEIHNFCFHKTGERKEYLNCNQSAKKIVELYEKFRRPSLQLQDISTVEESEMEYLKDSSISLGDEEEYMDLDSKEEHIGSDCKNKSSKKAKTQQVI